MKFETLGAEQISVRSLAKAGCSASPLPNAPLTTWISLAFFPT